MTRPSNRHSAQAMVPERAPGTRPALPLTGGAAAHTVPAGRASPASASPFAVTAPLSGTRGQASIEVLGFLPLVATIIVAALTIAASMTADEQAGEAAEAGALAVLQGGIDAEAAAREALPDTARTRSTVTVAGHRIHVRVRPHLLIPIPGLADRIAGEAHADAGP